MTCISTDETKTGISFLIVHDDCSAVLCEAKLLLCMDKLSSSMFMLTVRQFYMFRFGTDYLPSSKRNSFTKSLSTLVALWILALNLRVSSIAGLH
jgi:hypothetical protein